MARYQNGSVRIEQRSEGPTRRTSSPIPTSRRLVIVSRSSATIASDSFPSSWEPIQSPRGPRPDFSLHSPIFESDFRTPLRRCFKVASISFSSRGCWHAHEVFGNDKQFLRIAGQIGALQMKILSD
jgi:hypothetical protein